MHHPHHLLIPFLICITFALPARAQIGEYEANQSGQNLGDGTVVDANGQVRSTWGRDTSKVDRYVPTEYHQWKIDPLFGARMPEQYNDTLPHLFQNYNLTEGLRSEYNVLGNLGSPRMARNFLDRPVPDKMLFLQQYDYFHTEPYTILFTNTKSPLTNLQYHKCGTSETGQDRFRAYFAVNVNKRAGFGFKIDYLYGRGYYINQASSLFGGNLFGYYLGDRYDMHAFLGIEHMKTTENGGIEEDAYITDPESFGRSIRSRDIPTVLSNVWNRNDVQTYYLTHRYNIGKYIDLDVPDSLKPKLPEEIELWQMLRDDSLVNAIQADTLRRPIVLDSLKTAWMSQQVIPQQFVPVTSVFHTFKLQKLNRANYSQGGIPDDYFAHEPFYRSSYDINFQDETTALSLKNTVGIQLREGFNKWAKAGISLFAAHDFRRYALPSAETNDTLDVFDIYKENHISVGGEISKTQGRLLHYKARAEFWAIGPEAGDLHLQGQADLNFKLGRDTVHLAANASFRNITPAFFFRHYHSQTHWWDNSLSQETRTRVEGKLSIDRTATSLRFGMENISNYTHFASILTPNMDEFGEEVASYSHDVEVRQQSGSVQVLSATARQDLHFKFLHFDNEFTWQHSTNSEVLPLPMFSLYSNLYAVFHIAKVLRCELGVDLRYFSSYYAPDYAPFLNQYAIQDASQPRIKVGNYPVINVYANFALKRVRGYIQYVNLNSSRHAFWAPHYPVDPDGIRFGISWNFYD